MALGLNANELERLRFSYEEEHAEHKVKDRIAKRLLKEKISEANVQLEAKLRYLRDAESAMLNILEDAQMLQQELKKQKETVEWQVKERTRELKEEQARLIATIRGLSLGFIILDNDNNTVLTNPAIEKIFGRSDLSADWIAQQLGGQINFLEHLKICHEENKCAGVSEVEYGSRFLKIFFEPIVMIRDHSEVIGTAILLEDITEARILERAREEFFAIASHELRTPLTAIRGNMSLIKDFFIGKIKNREVKEMIDDSYSASVRLIGIVNDFLDVARLEQGRITLNKEPTDLVALTEEVVHELSALAESKKLKLIFNAADFAGLPSVLADRGRAKQIIYNLISNAINYTYKGGVIINIIREKDALKYLVSDTGEGISPENQALLFRKFQQAGEKILVRDVSKGTGLGLYISKLLMDAMNGRIWLEKSELGWGSTFAFTLPLAS